MVIAIKYHVTEIITEHLLIKSVNILPISAYETFIIAENLRFPCTEREHFLLKKIVTKWVPFIFRNWRWND